MNEPVEEKGNLKKIVLQQLKALKPAPGATPD